MKPYDIGTEVFAVVMLPIEMEIEGMNPKTQIQANTVIKTKIRNLFGSTDDHNSTVYEIDNIEGSIKANKIYEDFNQAKQAAIQFNEKLGYQKIIEAAQKRIDSLEYT